MPVAPTYPGVYVEELPSGVHTITGVSTAVTAFLGYFSQGPMNQATQIFSVADLERTFGSLVANSEADGTSIELASIAAPARTRLLEVQSRVVYSSGHLFYQRDGTLTAQPFDVAAARVTGQPRALVNGIDYNPADGSATFSVAANGTLAYRLATPPLQALKYG